MPNFYNRKSGAYQLSRTLLSISKFKSKIEKVDKGERLQKSEKMSEILQNNNPAKRTVESDGIDEEEGVVEIVKRNISSKFEK